MLFSTSVILWNSSDNRSFPGGSAVKNPPANTGDTGSIPESGRSPEEEMATHSSILAWEIPWMEEPGGYSPWGSQKSQTQFSDLTASDNNHIVLIVETNLEYWPSLNIFRVWG